MRRYDEGGLAALDEAEVMDPEGGESEMPGGAITQSGGLSALDIPGAREAFDLMVKSSADARRALQQARESIQSRKYNRAHALLAASAALGAPTRAGSTAESFGAMAGALRGPLAEREQFEQQQVKDLLGIDTSLAGLDEKSAQAQMALAQLRANLLNKERLTPNDRVVLPDGRVVWRARPDARNPDVDAWTPPGSTVTVDQRGETEQSKVINKFYGDDFAEMQKVGRAAPVQIAEMRRLGSYLDGIKTGKLTPLISELQSIGESLGIKINTKLGPMQAAEALSNGLALKLRNPAEGAGMPGALSNQDRNYLKQMVAGIGKSPDANKLMIEAAIKLAEREQVVARRARAYLKKHGKMDGDFYDELEEWANKNHVFGEPEGAPESAAATANAVADDELSEQDASSRAPPGIARLPGVPAIPSADDAAATEPGTISFYDLPRKK
jgi:hypothetical protein